MWQRSRHSGSHPWDASTTNRQEAAAARQGRQRGRLGRRRKWRRERGSSTTSSSGGSAAAARRLGRRRKWRRERGQLDRFELAAAAAATSSGACGTTDGTYEENTTFGTEGATDPYKLNKWGTWGNGTEPTLTQTTTGPSGLDCSSGCAKLTIDFSNGTKQYSAGSFVEYFGTTTDSVENLLNETITAKIAVGVEQASGASTAVPIYINLFGQDTYASTSGVDNLWSYDLGSASSLDAASGWHTVTFKVVDAKVPSWNPTRTVCASALHAIGITIQNNAVIDGTNGAVVTLYVQSVSVGDGGSSGSGGSGGGVEAVGRREAAAAARRRRGGGSGGSGGERRRRSGGSGGGRWRRAAERRQRRQRRQQRRRGRWQRRRGRRREAAAAAVAVVAERAGGGGAGASGGSTTSVGGCGTADGTYEEDTTFGTEGSTAPYKVNSGEHGAMRPSPP